MVCRERREDERIAPLPIEARQGFEAFRDGVDAGKFLVDGPYLLTVACASQQTKSVGSSSSL